MKTAQVYDQEEDEVRVGKEQEDGAGGGERGEVEITGEWTAGTRKEGRRAKKEAADKSSEDPGAMQMASRDKRYKEVKINTKNHKPKKKIVLNWRMKMNKFVLNVWTNIQQLDKHSLVLNCNYTVKGINQYPTDNVTLVFEHNLTNV